MCVGFPPPPPPPPPGQGQGVFCSQVNLPSLAGCPHTTKSQQNGKFLVQTFLFMKKSPRNIFEKI
ncbi:hypothetical protein [Chryseobacterium indoltheticum]|uniref:hypothetical protein n=1 Tax=Chryseobacterium indoltheticum TaxID=254 RepID=UPI003F491D85